MDKEIFCSDLIDKLLQLDTDSIDFNKQMSCAALVDARRDQQESISRIRNTIFTKICEIEDSEGFIWRFSAHYSLSEYCFTNKYSSKISLLFKKSENKILEEEDIFMYSSICRDMQIRISNKIAQKDVEWIDKLFDDISINI